MNTSESVDQGRRRFLGAATTSIAAAGVVSLLPSRLAAASGAAMDSRDDCRKTAFRYFFAAQESGDLEATIILSRVRAAMGAAGG